MMNNEPQYITAHGKMRLERDLVELETVKRDELDELVSEAANGSDSAENSEMQNLQHDRDLLTVRIETLRNTLENVTIIETDVVTDSVHIGSTVLIQEEDEEPESYMIVGSAEANPARGMISNVSPLGKLLLGKQAGDSVCVETHSETTCFRILRIQKAKDKRHYAAI